MGKPQYTQKFRKEWLNNKLFKDWIIEIEGDVTKARCKYCKCDLIAKNYDLTQHLNTKKHRSASSAFSSSTKLSKFVKPQTSSKSNSVEGSLSLFIAAHTSILPVDHLGVLCKLQFKGSDAANELKLHRSKCTNIILNVLAPHFNADLLKSIGDGYFSILIDESTDISVKKFLGITIIYFNKEIGEVVSTYLALVEISNCDAESITNAIKITLESKGLSLKKLVGIGTDNASVMVGINNGVHQKLKEHIPSLILVPCVCHSLQLAVSAAANDALPRHIDFLVKETYNWFSHSTLRQNEYRTLYKALNDGHNPLKIIKACGTRWLSIESAINRILEQWDELKLLFQIARTKEKCYSAEILYTLYKDEHNLAYLKFLSPVLFEVQTVNKAFESNSADSYKLLSSLSNLVQSISKKIINPSYNFNPIKTKFENKYLHPKPYLGYRFEKALKEIPSLKTEEEQILRQRCIHFLIELLKQFQQRLPKNIEILEKMSILSVSNTLKVDKDNLIPLLELMKVDDVVIDKINNQWINITSINWQETNKTNTFWHEVSVFKNASGDYPFKDLSSFAIKMLILPWSNAEVERLFSQMNLVKTKTRNKMSSKLLDSILTIRSGLKRKKMCCSNYVIPDLVLKKIGTLSTYSSDEPLSLNICENENDVDDPLSVFSL